MSTKDVKHIDWQEDSTLGKRHTDLLLLQELNRHGFIREWRKKDKVGMLNLSAGELVFEKTVLTMYPDIPWSFLALERNHVVHRRVLRNVSKLNAYMKQSAEQGIIPVNAGFYAKTTPQACTVNQYVLNTIGDVKLDFVNLDYMGTWSREKQLEIMNLLYCDSLNKRVAFSITISSARGQPGTMNELKRLSRRKTTFDYGPHVGEKSIFKAKTVGLENVLKELAEPTWNIRVLSFLPYKGFRSTEYKFLYELKRKAA